MDWFKRVVTHWWRTKEGLECVPAPRYFIQHDHFQIYAQFFTSTTREKAHMLLPLLNLYGLFRTGQTWRLGDKTADLQAAARTYRSRALDLTAHGHTIAQDPASTPKARILMMGTASRRVSVSCAFASKLRGLESCFSPWNEVVFDSAAASEKKSKARNKKKKHDAW